MNLLELRFYPIEGKQDCFKVSVEGSSGEVHHEPVLPFLDSETPDVQDRSFTVVKVLESTRFKEKDFSEDEQAWMVREQLLLPEQSAFKPQWLATIGRKLYQVLGQSIQQVIETAVADAKRDRTWLHIRLRFPADAPKYARLTDYPWELLYNEYGFLAHQGVTFSRYIAYRSPRPNLPSVERLNVLLISSGAGDDRMGLKPLPSLERDAIANELQHAQEQGVIRLEILEPPTWKAFRRRLLQRQTAAVPHVLHFDGHGFFGKRCNEAGCRKAYKQSATQCECGAPLGEPQGYLVFEQSDRTADYVSAQEVGELLGNLERREQPNSEQGIALVVLSGCRTGMSRLSESLFNGVAPNLIGRGIPAVVAMAYSISVRAASAFAEDFYYSLGQKDSLVSALRQGQRAIGIEGNEWYRPVLYLRWEDNEGGQIFKFPLAQPHSTPNTEENAPVYIFDESRIQQPVGTFIAIRHQSFEPLTGRLSEESLPDHLRHCKIQHIECDQSSFLTSGVCDPVGAVRQQHNQFVNNLLAWRRANPEAAISYYGIVHIPLQFCAGYAVSTWPKVVLFELDRNTNCWYELATGNGPKLGLSVKTISRPANAVAVAIRIAISFDISQNDLDDVVSQPYEDIQIEIEKRRIDAITHYNQVNEVCNAFRQVLDNLHGRVDKSLIVHVFYAGPVSLGFSLGRRISRTIHHQVNVYNYTARTSPRYAWGIKINSGDSPESSVVWTKSLTHGI
jgi:hypothetical protein